MLWRRYLYALAKNTGKKWSEMDLLDLANCIKLNDPVEET